MDLKNIQADNMDSILLALAQMYLYFLNTLPGNDTKLWQLVLRLS